MKKEYRKPEIVFESFALSTNIAASCAIDTDQHSQNVCGIYLPGIGNVFADDVNVCTKIVRPDDPGNTLYNQYCYHVPTDARSLFNS